MQNCTTMFIVPVTNPISDTARNFHYIPYLPNKNNPKDLLGIETRANTNPHPRIYRLSYSFCQISFQSGTVRFHPPLPSDSRCCAIQSHSRGSAFVLDAAGASGHGIDTWEPPGAADDAADEVCEPAEVAYEERLFAMDDDVELAEEAAFEVLAEPVAASASVDDFPSPFTNNAESTLESFDAAVIVFLR